MIQNIEYYNKNMCDIISYINHDIVDTDYFEINSLNLIEKYVTNNQYITKNDIQEFNIIMEKINMKKKINLLFIIISFIILLGIIIKKVVK
jgi:hypothetical protein